MRENQTHSRSWASLHHMYALWPGLSRSPHNLIAEGNITIVLRLFNMSPWSLALLLATCIASATADVFYVVDWVTAERANKSIPITGPSKNEISRQLTSKRQTPSQFTSGYGFFRHWSSGKYIHPWGNWVCPGDFTDLVVHRGYHTSGSTHFRFVQVVGHYGYLEHKCGKVVHPYKGPLQPADDTVLDLHQDRHAAALFTIDQDKKEIIHRSGKRFHPYGGWANPGDDTVLVLHGGRSDSARFEFVDTHTLQVIPVFPKPSLTGYWKVIYAVLNPKAHHEYQLTYTVGKTVTKTATSGFEWKVSAGVTLEWFQASTEFRVYAEKSETTTWQNSITRQTTIKVSPGKTVVTWQFFFEAEQFGDGLQFRSTILADTDDPQKQPELSQVMAQK